MKNISSLLNKAEIVLIQKKIISRLLKWTSDINILQTGNDSLNTKIYQSNQLFDNTFNIQLDSNEYVVLECLLPNNNYVLITTDRMISYYLNTHYVMSYAEYKTTDWDVYEKNKPIDVGKTKIFKYYKKDGSDFWYEIDSNLPAFFANNIILVSMQEVVKRIEYGTISDLLDRPENDW